MTTPVSRPAIITVRLTEAERRALDQVAEARGSSRGDLLRDGLHAVLNAPVTAKTEVHSGVQRVIYTVPDIPDTATEAEKMRLSIIGQSAIKGCCTDCNAIAHLEDRPEDGDVLAMVKPVTKKPFDMSVSLPPRPGRKTHPAIELALVIVHEPKCATRRKVTPSAHQHPSH
jgi:hypothetical protein